MLSPARLEDYMRRAAAAVFDVVERPPFVMFFNPTDPLTFFNYARPLGPVVGDLAGPLAALRTAFRARNRLPRFEFVEEFAPGLAPALEGAGFTREGRYLLMVCTPVTLQPAPPVPGLRLTLLEAGSPQEDLLALLALQQKVFGDGSGPEPGQGDVEQLRRELATAAAFLAWSDGIAVGGADFTIPIDGLTELVGIGTLETYRRRGIATAVTAFAAQTAFARGVSSAFLTAGDEQAGRVYTRVGFKPYAHLLAYVDGAAGQPARPHLA